MSSQVEALDGLEFRKRSGTSARDRAKAEAIVIDNLERYLTIEDILDIEPDLGWVEGLRCESVASEDDIDIKADQLRNRWNLGMDPIPSMCALLEGKGHQGRRGRPPGAHQRPGVPRTARRKACRGRCCGLQSD